MKKLVCALSLVCIFLWFRTEAQTPDYVVFSGKIDNPTNHELILYDVHNKKSVIHVNDKGHFADTIEVRFVGHHRFYDEKKSLNIYFEKGKDLHVTYDANDFINTVAFNGAGAAENNYILRKRKIKETHEKNLDSDLFAMAESDFRAYYLRLKVAMLKELEATSGLSEQFSRLEERNINYEYLYFLSQYETVHRNHLGNKEFKASKSVADEFKGLAYHNTEDFNFSEMYRNLVQSTYYEKAGKKAEAEGMQRDISYLKVLPSIGNIYISNYLMYRFASSYFNYSQDTEGFYLAFMKGSSNEEDKKRITGMYETIKSVKAKSPSPKFVDYENYAGGTSSLDDFKGKYVFIDVWATWCGPCIYEFPFLDTLENSYKGKNIEFITVSIDTKENREKWRQFVKDKDLDGVQLLADNAFESEFIKKYNINGIPRFLIIDPQGNIVSNNAPRPSDPKLRELLDSLPL